MIRLSLTKFILYFFQRSNLWASLPVTALVDQFYKDVQKSGGGRWDTSSLFKRMRLMG